jgi:hypothetical protein
MKQMINSSRFSDTAWAESMLDRGQTSSKTPELLMIILAQHRAPMDSPHIEPEAGKNTLYAPWNPSSPI